MMPRTRLLLAIGTALAAVGRMPAEPPAAVRTDRCGDPLPPGALLRLGTVRLRQQGHSFAFSPDNKRIASTGSDGLVHIWDVASGRERSRLDGFQSPQGVVYSPDGKFLAVKDFTAVHLWDMTTGKRVHNLLGLKPSVETHDLAFSPDGKFLAVGEVEAGISLWDVTSGDRVRRLDKCKGEPSAIVFLPNGKRLLVATRDDAISEGVVGLWDTHGRQLRKFEMKLSNPSALDVTPDGKTLAFGAYRSVPRQSDLAGLLSVWDLATGKERRRMETPGTVAGIALSPDGKTLAYAQDRASVIELRELDSWKEKPRIEVPEGSASDLAFSPDGKILAARVADIVQLWDLATGRQLAPGVGHVSAVDRVLFTANGRQLVSISENQRGETARVWDALTGQHLYMLPDATDCYDLCASRDGGLLLLGDTDTITIWDVAKRRRVRRMAIEKKHAENSSFPILALALSPDGRRMTVISRPSDESVAFQVWDIVRGARLSRRTLDLPELWSHHPTLSPDGQILVATDGRTIQLRDGVSGVIRQTLRAEKRAANEALWGRLVFSNDCRLLACISRPDREGLLEEAASTNGKVRVWELATGKEFPSLAAPWTQDIAFTPDGRTLATAGGAARRTANGSGTLEKPIRLWDIATGEEVGRYEGHGTLVGSMLLGAEGEALTFSPNGQTLATGLMDSTVLLWDVKPALQRVRKSLPVVREEDLPRLWADLAGADVRKAQASLRALAATPKIALPFLQQRLTPARAADPERLRRLIADLDSEQFTVRKAAYAGLRKLDLLAEPALRKVLEEKPSLERRRRIEDLLTEMRGPVTASAMRQNVRAVAVLEHMDSDEARHLLKKLAGGTPEARLTRQARAAGERLLHP